MYPGLLQLQDLAVVDHSDRNIPAHVDGRQCEADRDGCDHPWQVNGHRPSLGDMGLVPRDNNAPLIHRIALAGPHLG